MWGLGQTELGSCCGSLKCAWLGNLQSRLFGDGLSTDRRNGQLGDEDACCHRMRFYKGAADWLFSYIERIGCLVNAVVHVPSEAKVQTPVPNTVLALWRVNKWLECGKAAAIVWRPLWLAGSLCNPCRIANRRATG